MVDYAALLVEREGVRLVGLVLFATRIYIPATEDGWNSSMIAFAMSDGTLPLALIGM